MPDLVGAIDQGTTSSRFFLFDRGGNACGGGSRPHRQFRPGPGRVEHDPVEILDNVRGLIDSSLAEIGAAATDVAAIGVTNQRETCLVWDRRTGVPFHRAIVWQDTRTAGDVARLREGGRDTEIHRRSGLPLSPYFSASKFAWLLDEVPGLRSAAARGEALFGTIDSWLIWNLTGGPAGGAHVTDVTNASRTMLVNLSSLQWDDHLLETFGIPDRVLPEIRSSVDPAGYGDLRAAGGSIPITAALGDQQAALIGHACFVPGEAKNTFGTGGFLLANTGTDAVRTAPGLIPTVAYRFGTDAAVYALEGSVSSVGSAAQWLRDGLGLVPDVAEVESLAARAADGGDVWVVPAFDGLLAPHWRSDVHGLITGLTHRTSPAEIARATLEAIAHQTADVLDAVDEALGRPVGELRVDGGMAANALCMQLQAEVLNRPVTRSAGLEGTALGAAQAAGLAVGHWQDVEELRALRKETRRWTPTWPETRRRERRAGWRRAVNLAMAATGA